MNLILSLLIVGSLWESDSVGDFRRGDFTNTSLSGAPEVKLGPDVTMLGDTRQLLVLCLAQDLHGTVFAGTGADGAVYRIDEGKPKAIFSMVPGQVLSLVTDRDGNLYAGTGPDGVIYQIKGDKSEEYFATHQKYVWSLALDDAGALYAGTGDSGLIYKITGKGSGSALYHASDQHIMSLAWSHDLYAGSSGSGLVYRIRGSAAQVLFKTDRKEVKGLVVDPTGIVYAAANPDEKSSDAKPQVYRIRPDGNASVLFTPQDSMIFCLGRRTTADGRHPLLVGTGSKARVYEVNPDTAAQDYGVENLLLESDEGQILSLLTGGDGKRVILGTGNSGKVFRIEPGFAREGTFDSRVFDAGAISHWGRCFWTARTPLGTGLTVTTRTGNSDHPDDTWEGWQALSGEMIASRPARYIQLRAKLATADNSQTPALARFTIAYEQTNLPPVIKSVQVKPSDDQNRWQDRVITWDASDPNSDSLALTISIKGETDRDWIVLERNKTGLTRYVVDSDRLPDGWYLAKVAVSDRPSRSLGTEFTVEKTSPRFLVDNTPPRIADISVSPVSGNQYRLTWGVSDDLSIITKCEISTNVRDWRAAAPESGIFDSPNERFSVLLDLNKGENVIVIRAQDDAANTGTGKKVVEAQ